MLELTNHIWVAFGILCIVLIPCAVLLVMITRTPRMTWGDPGFGKVEPHPRNGFALGQYGRDKFRKAVTRQQEVENRFHNNSPAHPSTDWSADWLHDEDWDVT